MRLLCSPDYFTQPNWHKRFNSCRCARPDWHNVLQLRSGMKSSRLTTIHSFSCWFTHSFIHLYIHLLICSFINVIVHSFIRLFINSKPWHKILITFTSDCVSPNSACECLCVSESALWVNSEQPQHNSNSLASSPSPGLLQTDSDDVSTGSGRDGSCLLSALGDWLGTWIGKANPPQAGNGAKPLLENYASDI